MTVKLQISRDAIANFCRRHHIRKLSLFGSAIRDDFGSESDVDVLVEFEAGRTPGLALFAMEEELTGLLGRRVDLNTPGFLSSYFRDRVMTEAVVQYDATRTRPLFVPRSGRWRRAFPATSARHCTTNRSPRAPA